MKILIVALLIVCVHSQAFALSMITQQDVDPDGDKLIKTEEVVRSDEGDGQICSNSEDCSQVLCANQIMAPFKITALCKNGTCKCDERLEDQDERGQEVKKKPTAPSEAYLVSSLYCERNADCAVRGGACGPEAMNIHFDNTKLIEMRPFVECADYVELENPRCEEDKCIADVIGKGPGD